MTTRQARELQQFANNDFGFYIIGDANGRTNEGLDFGYMRVRPSGSLDNSAVEIVLAGDADTTYYEDVPGYPVVVTTSRYYGKKVIKGTDSVGLIRNQINPLRANPGSVQYRGGGFVDLSVATHFLAMPTTPPSTSLVVGPMPYRNGNTWALFAGDPNVDLSAEIAALGADERRLVVLYLDKTTNTIETQLTSVKTGPESADPYTYADDIQPAQNSATEDAIPSAAYRLRAGQTQITWSDRWADLRPWIDGSGGDTSASYYRLMRVNTVDQTQRSALDFVDSTTIEWVGTDDGANDETEIEANIVDGSVTYPIDLEDNLYEIGDNRQIVLGHFEVSGTGGFTVSGTGGVIVAA